MTRGCAIFYTAILMAFLSCAAIADAAQLTLKLEPIAQDVDGYAIFQRFAGQPYNYQHPLLTGADSTLTIDNLLEGKSYFFVARSFRGFDASADSNEIQYTAGGHDPASSEVTIIDDGQAGTASIGTWTLSGGAVPYGTQSLYSREIGARYSFASMLSGRHEVALWWTHHASRCSAVPVKIYDGDQLIKTITVNQQHDGGRWNVLGTHDFSGRATVVVVSEDSACSTNADAAKFTVVKDPGPVIIDDGGAGAARIGTWTLSGGAVPYGTQSLYSREIGAQYSFASLLSGRHAVALWWTDHTSRCSAVPVEIYDGNALIETIIVNQQHNGGQWNVLGTYDFSGRATVVVASEDYACSTNADAAKFSVVKDLEPVIIDDGGAGTAMLGTWTLSGGAAPYGRQSLYSREIGARYSFASMLSGRHEVALWWTNHTSRCSAVPVEVYDGNALLETIIVNQQHNGGRWNVLGTYDFSGRATVVVVSEDNACSTNADAAKFTVAKYLGPVIIDDGGAGTAMLGTWALSGGAAPYGRQSLYSREIGARYSFTSVLSGRHEVALWWTHHTSRCSAVPVEIYDGNGLVETITVNQQHDGGQWNVLGTYNFSGRATVVVVSTDNACSTNADAVRYE